MTTVSTLSEYEKVLLAAYMIPRGITMFKLDRESGLSSAPLATPRYLELLRQDPVLLRENGVTAVTQHVPDADREVCDMEVLASSERELLGEHVECAIAFRVRQPDGTSPWMRQWTLTGQLSSGYVAWSCLVEPFDEQASRMIETLNEERCERMIATLCGKVFDCCLCTDERMRILSDSTNCRKSVYGDTSRSLKGAPLESLVPLDQHKLALRSYIQSRKRCCMNLVAPLRLRMNLRKQMLMEVGIQVFPAQEGGYIVGIEILRQKETPKISSKQKTKLAVIEQPKPRAAFTGPDVIAEVYRNVIRDLLNSVQLCERINGWLVPVRKPMTPEAITDYLLMAIPEHLQADFAEAADKADYQSCAQMLSFTGYGNANILSSARWKQLTDNSDLIHTVYRFFANLVPQLADQPARQFSLLSNLHDAQKALLSKRLDRECYTSTVYRFAIVILSAAARNPEYYSTDISIHWLRSVFVDALKLPIPEEEAGQKLLLVYWMCIIWAGAMHGMKTDKRTEEAIAVLKGLEGRLDNYLRKIPCSATANELMTLCLTNLKTSADRNERKRLAKKIDALAAKRQVTL